MGTHFSYVIYFLCYLGMGLLGADYKVLVTQMKVYRDESVGDIGNGLGKKGGVKCKCKCAESQK